MKNQIQLLDVVALTEGLPEKYLMITLTSISKNERKIELCSYGRCYEEIIDKLVIN